MWQMNKETEFSFKCWFCPIRFAMLQDYSSSSIDWSAPAPMRKHKFESRVHFCEHEEKEKKMLFFKMMKKEKGKTITLSGKSETSKSANETDNIYKRSNAKGYWLNHPINLLRLSRKPFYVCLENKGQIYALTWWLFHIVCS